MTDNRIIGVSFAAALVAALVVVSRVGGAFLPLEVLAALAAIAALAGYATLEVFRGAPRGINHGYTRRFQKDFVRTPAEAQVVPMWSSDERKAA